MRMNEPGTSSYDRGDPRGCPGCVRILVIRPGAIGDVLLTFPVLKALRELYANAHVTLVSNAQVLPLALACGVTEEVSDYQDMQWGELFSTTGIRTPALAGLLDRTDLAICWIRDADGIVQRNLRAAGVKRLIISPGRPPEGTHMHIVDYLAQTVGLPPVGPRLWRLNIQSDYVHHLALLADKSAVGTINRPLRYDQGISSTFINALPWNTGAAVEDAHKQYVAIHPGSGGAQKCWPASHFAAVIERLWQQNRPVLLLEGPADTECVRNLLNLVPSPPVPKMLKVLTNAPLLEVARLLQQCRCFLGNDSGITHLAAMLGVPTVAIFGPSDQAVWRPVGPYVKVIQERALEDVPADVVVEAINVFSKIK
jgi:heptosyltransferase-3